jgi:hypothetical protein
MTADPGRRTSEGQPIVCMKHTFSAEDRRRYDELRARILAAAISTTETPKGFRLELRDVVAPVDVAEWAVLERRCCPFLEISLLLNGAAPTVVELAGSAAVKAFLRKEFRFA